MAFIILLHDNAKLHVLRHTVPKVNQLQYEILPHSNYSLDLSPIYYHFFKYLDYFLAEKVFWNCQKFLRVVHLIEIFRQLLHAQA